MGFSSQHAERCCTLVPLLEHDEKKIQLGQEELWSKKLCFLADNSARDG